MCVLPQERQKRIAAEEGRRAAESRAAARQHEATEALLERDRAVEETVALEQRYAVELRSLQGNVTSVLARAPAHSQVAVTQRALREALECLTVSPTGIDSFEAIDRNGDSLIDREEWRCHDMGIHLRLDKAVRELGGVIDQFRRELEDAMNINQSADLDGSHRTVGLDRQIHTAGKQVILAFNALADVTSGCVDELSQQAHRQQEACCILRESLTARATHVS